LDPGVGAWVLVCEGGAWTVGNAFGAGVVLVCCGALEAVLWLAV